MMRATMRWCVSGVLALSLGVALSAADVSSVPVAETWYRLARYLEADQQYGEAAKAIGRALKLAPQSVPMLLTAARIHERRDATLDAVEVYEKLATMDRRLRSEHLKKIAQLEAKLGRKDRALAAGREVLAAAPGNPDAFELFAQLCFQFGANDEGMSTLRRAVRANPSDTRTILLLANAQAEQFRTAEAIDLLWTAFEKSRTLDDKLTIVQRLTDLAAQVNQFDKLVERLKRLRRETKEPRELTICLAQAQQQANDETAAREELESLWSAETRDTQLLQQLVKLCEATSDWEDAVKYQRQFNRAAPGREGDLRLARLLGQLGNADAASELFLKSTEDETDPERLLKTLDSLLQHGRYNDVVKVTSRRLADVGHVSNVPSPSPTRRAGDVSPPVKAVETVDLTKSNGTTGGLTSPAGLEKIGTTGGLTSPAGLEELKWELLYREGVALAMTQNRDASARFEALLKLTLPDDEPDAATKSKQQREASNSPVRGAVTPATSAAMPRSPFQQRIAVVHTVRYAIAVAVEPSMRVAGSPFSWTPTDFGQCRAAANVWLHHLAQRESRESQFLAERRVFWEQHRTELRAVLDWYYLQAYRLHGPDVFEAAKVLSQLPDAPLGAKFLFLDAVAQRSNVPQMARTVGGATFATQVQSRTPAVPLSNADFEHLVACMEEVHRKSDDATLLQFGWNPTGLLSELRRGSREAQAQQLYASLLHDATTPARAISLWPEVVQAGDIETLRQLLRVIFPDDEPSGGAPNRALAGFPSYYMTRDYHAHLMMTLMAAQVRKGELSQQVQTFESFLTRTLKQPRAKVSPIRVIPITTTTAQAQALANRQSSIAVYQGASWPASQTALQWNTPFPTEHFDRPLMNLLAQMYSSHQWATKLDDLCSAFRLRADDESRTDRLYWRLGLSYLEWQRDQRQTSLAELSRAITLVPENVSLKLELARRCEQANEPAKALEVLESLLDHDDEPLDHDSRRDAELMVLRLAMRPALRTEHNDRAKLAAERLFNMNLDANMLLEVSKHMETLGMTDLADAVQNRTRNKAGNQSDVLLSVMREYLSKQQLELAAEVAHQLLRRTPRQTGPTRQTVVRSTNGTSRVATVVSGGAATSASIRLEALKVLLQAGRLAEMIVKAEEQLHKSPNSNRSLETLAEYLQAAGQTARDPDVAKRIAALQQSRINATSARTASAVSYQPPDEVAILRTQLQRGDIAGAVSALESMMKRSPGYVATRWKEIDTAFHAVQRRDEFVPLCERADATTLAQCWTMAGATIGEMLRKPEQRQRGIKLLGKTLDATPDNLSGLLILAGVTPEVCATPEIAAHIRRAVIPSAKRPLNDYWQGTRLLATAHASQHSLTAFATVLLDTCDEPEELIELERSIDEVLKSSTVWPGGRVLKGMILLRRGKHADGEKVLNEVIDDFKATMPAETREVIAREVEDIVALQPLAMRAYESLASSTPWPLDPSTGPVQRLIRLYSSAGQREKARDLLLKNVKRPPSVLNTTTLSERELTILIEIAKQLRSLDFDVESARVCRDTLARHEYFAAMPASNAKLMRGRLEDSLRRAVTKFDADKLFEFLIGSPDNRPAGGVSLPVRRASEQDSEPAVAETGGLTSPARQSSRATSPVIADWVLVVDPPKLEESRLHSLLFRVLEQTATESVTATLGLKAKLAPLRKQHPDDLSLTTLSLLLTLAEKSEPRFADESLVTLRSLSEQLRQPAESVSATRHVIVWLIARECLASAESKSLSDAVQQELRDIGHALGERAVSDATNASASPSDQEQGLAILSEWCRINLGREDAELAEKRWRRALSILGVTLRADVPRDRVPATPSQWERSLEIATLAAKHKQLRVSLKAIADPLSFGPPMERYEWEHFQANDPQSSGYGPNPRDDARYCLVMKTIAEHLAKLLSTWRELGLTDEQLHETLLSIVFPPSRPRECFLYARPVPLHSTEGPQGLGTLLVQTAIAAQKADALKVRLDKLAAMPQGELGARVLLTQLAAAQNQPEEVEKQLTRLRELLRPTARRSTIEAITQAVVAARRLDKSPPALAPLMEDLAEKSRAAGF